MQLGDLVRYSKLYLRLSCCVSGLVVKKEQLHGGYYTPKITEIKEVMVPLTSCDP